MKKKAKSPKIPEELFVFMAGFDDSALSDGTWQAILQDSVAFYNTKNSTNFDPYETFLAYCARTSPF